MFIIPTHSNNELALSFQSCNASFPSSSVAFSLWDKDKSRRPLRPVEVVRRFGRGGRVEVGMWTFWRFRIIGSTLCRWVREGESGPVPLSVNELNKSSQIK